MEHNCSWHKELKTINDIQFTFDRKCLLIAYNKKKKNQHSYIYTPYTIIKLMPDNNPNISSISKNYPSTTSSPTTLLNSDNNTLFTSSIFSNTKSLDNLQNAQTTSSRNFATPSAYKSIPFVFGDHSKTPSNIPNFSSRSRELFSNIKSIPTSKPSLFSSGISSDLPDMLANNPDNSDDNIISSGGNENDIPEEMEISTSNVTFDDIKKIHEKLGKRYYTLYIMETMPRFIPKEFVKQYDKCYLEFSKIEDQKPYLNAYFKWMSEYSVEFKSKHAEQYKIYSGVQISYDAIVSQIPLHFDTFTCMDFLSVDYGVNLDYGFVKDKNFTPTQYIIMLLHCLRSICSNKWNEEFDYLVANLPVYGIIILAQAALLINQHPKTTWFYKLNFDTMTGLDNFKTPYTLFRKQVYHKTNIQHSTVYELVKCLKNLILKIDESWKKTFKEYYENYLAGEHVEQPDLHGVITSLTNKNLRDANVDMFKLHDKLNNIFHNFFMPHYKSTHENINNPDDEPIELTEIRLLPTSWSN
ncbi:hypothetical protein PV326_004888 [Microctonus aethiopoides]|nr:hypothetical protein PV326_004888 [Microctonus aethiopoides]